MIGFVGLSHLGIVSSAAAAAKGLDVVGYDADASLVERLRRGDLPVLEPGLPELIERAVNRLHFTSDAAALAECDVVVFSRDVPTDESNRSDLSELEDTIRDVAAQVASGTVLVVLSQVRPGFTRRMARRLAAVHAEKRLHVFYQVETLVFGRAVERAIAPERIIVGATDPGAELPAAYTRLLNVFSCPILRMRYESAELAKISINMCLVASVTMANTLAEVCEAIGADWAEIVPALRSDPRIGPHAYLGAGLGIAGGNLERDVVTVRSLADEFGTDAGVVGACLENSVYRKQWPLAMLHRHVFATTKTPTVAVWGLAYKPQTRSTKNSPALELLDALDGMTVTVFDPEVSLDHVRFPNVESAASAVDACAGADVLVIMTAWPEFAHVLPATLAVVMRGRTIVDPFGVLPEDACGKAGFTYMRLGAPVDAGEMRA